MPRDVDLAEIIDAALESFAGSLFKALPAKVESYDAAKQTANCLPVIKRPAFDSDGNKTLENFPVIPNVPVCFPRGGGMSITFPISAGDHVLLVFSDLATGTWRQSGQVSDPGDVRRHSMGYPFAIPGAFPDADATDQTDSAVVVSGDVKLGSKSAASFAAKADLVLTQLTTLATALNAFIVVYNAHTHPAGAPSTGPPSANGAPAPAPSSVACAKVKVE